MSELQYIDYHTKEKTTVDESNFFDFGSVGSPFESFGDVKRLIEENKWKKESNLEPDTLFKYKFTHFIRKVKSFHGLCGFKYEYERIVRYKRENNDYFEDYDMESYYQFLAHMAKEGWTVIPRERYIKDVYKIDVYTRLV